MRIMHANVEMFDREVMMHDEFPEHCRSVWSFNAPLKAA